MGGEEGSIRIHYCMYVLSPHPLPPLLLLPPLYVCQEVSRRGGGGGGGGGGQSARDGAGLGKADVNNNVI